MDGKNGRFTYNALPDAATHIRLIEVHNAPQDGGRIEIEISSWPLAEVPEYQAVSYTWGEVTSTETILIRGYPGSLHVRRNCADVLRQAFHFKPDGPAYFWVDAICINQQDSAEKSYQVAMMGDIFENAECVFACVGMHDESSEFLAKALHDFEAMLEAGGGSLSSVFSEENEESADDGARGTSLSPKEQCLTLCGLWFQRISDENGLRFMQACDEFPKRSYFWRIWNLQELYLAREIRIICGFNELSLASLLFWWRYSKLYFSQLFVEKLPQEYLEKAPWTDGEYILDQGGSGLGDVFEDMLCNNVRPQPRGKMEMCQEKVIELCEPRHCQDPRDIIYGTLRIMDWDGIEPDYSKPTWELATNTMSKFGSTRELLQFIGRLHISRDDPELSDLVHSRLESADLTEKLDETDIPEFPDEKYFPAGGFQLTPDSSWRIIRAQKDGADFCRIIGPSGKPSAVAHTNVHLDDWLVRTTRHAGVILRRINYFYQVVGPVRFLSESDLPNELSAFLLFFDPEDLVVHLAQDDCRSGEFETMEDEDTSVIASLQVRVCKNKLSSWAWRPEKECFFNMYGFLDMKPDVILPTLTCLYKLFTTLNAYRKAGIDVDSS
ncbi:hypothetical protein PFICI_03158 [Pestalotiopsis fici W106-1]|uniref:Heterokaryon incompatibility domain-containing protein n=1 Tax=Pestalotiopsis fici (strain W106-1 / CGMCC3.15140) TaxID=1229662 RepID=W3XGA7_PESFW|nr:uncharacterized protein PFICI_03158 [Pestalotiopsis fici W106-1]ETS85133.1 hypothetical protein PFICI_03158 [Pestalotiopsis fici W106-1]